ncbi:sirohydrochlorin chelatase [Malaciobacter canalis]|uniref:sirohydrochlorin chelatase n=1 Tax=Malaciobacter canalis TaxID=1912871 RepID=UPI00384EB360
MKLLVIIAHGSRLESSNKEIHNLAEKLKINNIDNNLKITYAFLELCEPSINKSIKDEIINGCNEIEVFPYFLAAGKHVKDDIPKEIDKLKEEYPDIKFKILPHLGSCKEIVSLIFSQLQDKD